MSLYLVQHGKSASKEVDPERGLTEEGAAEVKQVAARLAQTGVAIDLILHSGKARALQTAELFAASLAPAQGVASCSGIDPMDDVTAFAEGLDPAINAMYVGHLPFMERLVSHVLTGDPERRLVAFQNAGVVRLDHDCDEARWFLKWTAFPALS